MCIWIFFFYFSTKTYVVRTQKNCLNETAPKTYVKIYELENIHNCTLKCLPFWTFCIWKNFPNCGRQILIPVKPMTVSTISKKNQILIIKTDYRKWYHAFVHYDRTYLSPSFVHLFTYGPWREKTCLQGFANNTGADQPPYPHSLISTLVIHFLGSTICKLGTGEISIF